MEKLLENVALILVGIFAGLLLAGLIGGFVLANICIWGTLFNTIPWYC